MPSPLAFVIIAAPALVAAMGALLCLILALFYVVYIQPALDWLTRDRAGFLGGLIRWATRPLRTFVRDFIERHVALLLRTYLAGIAPGVLMVRQLDHLVQRLTGTIADMSEQTWRALWHLRHRTVPRLIAQALAPIRAQLRRHTGRLDTLEDLNRRVAVTVGTGLRSLPWGVPGSYVGNFQTWWTTYRHLWNQTFGHILPRLNRVQQEMIPRLDRRLDLLTRELTQLQTRVLPGIRLRIGRIEDWLSDLRLDPQTWVLTMLGLTALPALSAVGMRTALRNLTCRNTQRVAQELCRQPANFLDDLLALGLPILVLADVCSLARAGRALASAIEPLARGMLAGAGAIADCASIGPAPDLPLRAAARPAVANPLPL